MHTGEEVFYEITMQGYEAIDITVKRDGKIVVLEDVVFNTVEESGVLLADVDFKLYALSALGDVNFFDYLYQAFYRSINMVKMVFDSLIGLITNRFGMEAVSGPVGIVETVGEVASVSVGALVNLIVLISMNLGIFNLLPIPALDGGRLVFILFEMIARKPVPQKYESLVHAIGFVVLIGFMLLVTAKDIWSLIF